MEKSKTYIGKIVGVSGISLFGIMLLSYFSSRGLTFDLLGVELSQVVKGDNYTNILVVISNVMSVWGIIAIGIVLGFYLLKRDRKKMWYLLLCYTTLIGVGSLLVQIIKFLVQRARPLTSMLDFTGYSFPSGHSFSAMVVYGFLILITYYYEKKKIKRVVLYLLFLTLIIFTGYSRIYLGAHYITDVLAGYGFGIFALAVCNHYIKKVTYNEKNI